MKNSTVRAIRLIALVVMVASVLLAVCQVYNDIDIMTSMPDGSNYLIFGTGVLVHILFYFGIFMFMFNTLKGMKSGVFFVSSNVWLLLLIACTNLCFKLAWFGVGSLNSGHRMRMFCSSIVNDVPQFVMCIFIVLLYKLAVSVSDEQRLTI